MFVGFAVLGAIVYGAFELYDWHWQRTTGKEIRERMDRHIQNQKPKRFKLGDPIE